MINIIYSTLKRKHFLIIISDTLDEAPSFSELYTIKK